MSLINVAAHATCSMHLAQYNTQAELKTVISLSTRELKEEKIMFAPL